MNEALMTGGGIVITSLVSLAIYLIKEFTQSTDERFNGVSSSLKAVQDQAFNHKMETVEKIGHMSSELSAKIMELEKKIIKLETENKFGFESIKESVKEAKEKKTENYGRVVVKD